MKKNLLLIATAIAFGFTSCSEDDCDHIIKKSPNVSFVGSWYEEDTNEEMRYGANGTFYDKYCNVQRSGETEGNWEYDAANSKLTCTYQYMGQTQFSDFTIKNLTEIGFTLSSTKVADHVLEKIVETYQLEVGNTANIQFATSNPSYTVQSYTSKNERLASVTTNGTITAEGEKGTTYIKVATDKGNVWVKVIVGDDCLDLWYDYPSLMSTNYSTVRNVLGTPDATGDDGYSYGFVLPYSDYATEIDVFLESEHGTVEEMALALKSGVPESLILAYLGSHYYVSDFATDYYTTGPDIENSVSVVRYDKNNNVIRFYVPDYWRLPDYTSNFGLTKDEIIAKFGELYYGTLAYYNIMDSYYFESIYFYFDKNTGKVTAFTFDVKNTIDPEILHKHLSSKYNFYQSENGLYAYRDGDSKETSKIMIVYNSTKSEVIYYDLENFTSSSSSARLNNYDIDLMEEKQALIK